MSVKEETYNLALSGGGIKGVAHAALLEWLKDKPIKIGMISGSSAGALVGAFYGAGMSSQEMVSFFKTTPLFKLTWVSPSKPGIFDTDKYISILEKLIPSTFEELQTPLVIATTDLETGCVKYFDSGDLYYPLIASCAIPFLFSPVEINGKLHGDGGIMNNFPIEPLLKQENKTIGSNVCKPGVKSKEYLNSSLKVTNHANTLLLQAANEHKFKMVDKMYDFDLSMFGTFDSKKTEDMFKTSMEYLSTLSW